MYEGGSHLQSQRKERKKVGTKKPTEMALQFHISLMVTLITFVGWYDIKYFCFALSLSSIRSSRQSVNTKTYYNLTHNVYECNTVDNVNEMWTARITVNDHQYNTGSDYKNKLQFCWRA